MRLFEAYDDEEEFSDDDLDEDELETDASENDLDFDSEDDESDLVATVALDEEDDDWGFDDPEEIEDGDWEDDDL